MLIVILLGLIFLNFHSAQVIQTLTELSIDEELPIGSWITSLTDKIPNLDQAIEYDLIKPISSDWDLFAINHSQHALIVKHRIDYEKLCAHIYRNHPCTISVSIAVSNADTIDVYMLPIHLLNINDHQLRFPVNRTVIEIEENDPRWFEKSYALPRAIDEDGDPISYSLYLQNWQKPLGLFQFDESQLRLKPLKSFDREEQNIYLLRLVAHNHHDLSLDVIILIKDQNDHPPRCQSNETLFIIENISSSINFTLNVTDLDEGENGQLEYSLVNPGPGFSIDRSNGQIRFDANSWIRSNQSILRVNVTDHGKPQRLSSECHVEIRFPNLFQIDFQSDHLISNRSEMFLPVEDFHRSLGRFLIFDQLEKNLCSDCQLNITSSFPDLFILNHSTFDLYFNAHSYLLMRILTNYYHLKEFLPIDLTVSIFNSFHPAMITSKTYSFILHFDKKKLFHQYHRFYLRLEETLPLEHRISLATFNHPCFNNQSHSLNVIDPSQTFALDEHFHLILKKHLSVKRTNMYHLKIEPRSSNHRDCSFDLHIYIIDPYSNMNVDPYFSEPFAILSAPSLTEFSLPPLPSHVKYSSSVPDLISIDPLNGSIRLLSPTLRTFSYYDFQIQTVDSQTPSLSSSMGIRIFFSANQHPPQLVINSTRQLIDVHPSKFLFQISAYDPDLLLTDQLNLFPPSIEYQIESNEHLEIERYSGRIFLTNLNVRQVNFTLLMTDFGQPNRLMSRQELIFDLKSTQSISIPMILLGTSIVVVITIFTALTLVLIGCCCCCCCFRSMRDEQKSKTQQKSWTNISPNTPDTRLIDHEYLVTNSTSLPRVYPSLSYSVLQSPRLFVSHSSLDRHCSIEKISFKTNDQQCLSMTDINKYLERFEKIYHDSSSEQYLHQPIGSVV